MKSLLACLMFLTPAVALAAGGPMSLGGDKGKFGDWTAATYGTGAAKVCYAFTPAQHSKPALHSRGDVLLTVSERAGVRDEVTVSAGYTYPKAAKVTLKAGSGVVAFYTQGATAFTDNGAGAVAAFRNGASAETVSTGPHGKPVTDDFSLKGFSGAYHQIVSACP